MTPPATYQRAINDLFSRVPAFATARALDESYMSYDDDSPYLVFGDFARFIINLVKHESDTADAGSVLAESFKLLGEMATSADNDLANLAVVGVFEVLADTPESTAVARRYLCEKARAVFERVVNGWLPTDNNQATTSRFNP